MSRNELIAKIEALNEWEQLMEEAKTQVEAIKESLKDELIERNVEELEAGSYIIRYKTVSTSRFDSTAFKKNYTDLYKEFLRQTVIHRFTISC